jgi:hypothetical protein
MEIVFTRAARKHRIGRAHARHVILNTVPEHRPGAGLHGDAILWFVGRDRRGVELEIAAIELIEEQILLVTHVMPTALRRKRSS